VSVRLFGSRDPDDPSIGRLDAAAARHLRARRIAPGDAVVLVLGPEDERDATVLRIESGGATCRLGATRPASGADPVRPTRLCVGLADLARLDLVVEKATELGASAITVFRARRSQLASVPAARLERWRRIALSACEQCGRTAPPSIEVVDGVQEVADLVASAALAVVFVAPRENAAGGPGTAAPADVTVGAPGRAGVPAESEAPSPAAARGGATGARSEREPLVLVVGPEGGLDAQEIDALLAAGAHVGSLGPRVLRFETAAIAALARHAGPVDDRPTGVPGGALE